MRLTSTGATSRSLNNSILDKLWNKGELHWKLLDHQRALYELYWLTNHRKVVWHCSRRFGKSTVLLAICNEIAIRNPNMQIRYGASTQKDVREMILPLQNMLIADAPAKSKPEWFASELKYKFPNGSQIVISGCDDGRADNLRGTACHLAVLDEAGFIDDLEYVIRSVLMPQFLTTDGRMILSSTSPKTPAHPFITFLEESRQSGAYVLKTIYDDTRPEVQARIPEWMKESGGANSTTWKREYLCEILTDQESALVPEFNAEKAKAIVKVWPTPPFATRYISMDLGLIDYTAILFAYVDFMNAKLVICDEILMNRQDSQKIAEAIKEKQKEMWPNLGNVVYIADGAALTIHDFNALHNLPFGQTPKQELEAMVNSLRIGIQSERIVIDPKCQNTIQQLKYGVWDKAHKKFDRSSAYGHFDLVAAIMYLYRGANFGENPYPLNWGIGQNTFVVNTPNGQVNESYRDLANALTGGLNGLRKS